MRFLGIPVSLDSSAVILFLITMMSGSFVVGPSASPLLTAVGGIIFTAIIIFSLLFHERAHIWAAARYKIGCRGILIHGFGGFALLEDFPKTPGKYFAVVVAGPLSSLFLAGSAKLLALAVPFSGLPASSLNTFFVMNLILGIGNCLPIFPLDGGRMLYAGLWKLGTNRVAAQKLAIRIARVLIIGLLAFSAFQFAHGTLDGFGLIWRFVLAFLIWRMQKSENP